MTSRAITKIMVLSAMTLTSGLLVGCSAVSGPTASVASQSLGVAGAGTGSKSSALYAPASGRAEAEARPRLSTSAQTASARAADTASAFPADNVSSRKALTGNVSQGRFAKTGFKKTGTNQIRTAQGRAAAKRAVLKLSAVSKPGSNAYKIGPQDVLAISVFKVPELSKDAQVSDAGTVNLPLVGEIVAAGRTARQVEHQLTKDWGAKYLQNPQVTVFVKEYNSQRVTIEGAVKKPGVFPIRGRLTLLQAIATVGGLGPSSDSTVLIFRQHKGKRQAARFDIADIRSGAAADPRLQAGDVVVAGTSAMKATFNNILKALPLASVFALL